MGMPENSTNDRLSYLFQQYLHKTYTPEEYDELMQLISQPANDAFVRSLIDEGWNIPLPEYEQNAAKANHIFSTIIEQRARPQSRKLQPLIKYTAAAVLIIALGIGIYYYTKPTPAPVVKQTQSQTPARHRYLKLPDGSTVLLNTGSELTYPDSFGNTREVHLTGEAYFDIHHNPDKPFIVYAGNTRTVVLGTAFDIKAFPGEQNVIVTVTRGKVRVEKDKETVGILTPNEQLTVFNNDSPIKKATVNTIEAIAWKQDDLLFDDAPLLEAVQQLEERFGCTIILSNKTLGNCRVSASFLHNETLQEVIQVISRINRMDANMGDNKTITLSGEGCL